MNLSSRRRDVLNEQNKFYSSLYSNKETEDNLNVHLVDTFLASRVLSSLSLSLITSVSCFLTSDEYLIA
jgi:hypothetical protein